MPGPEGRVPVGGLHRAPPPSGFVLACSGFEQKPRPCRVRLGLGTWLEHMGQAGWIRLPVKACRLQRPLCVPASFKFRSELCSRCPRTGQGQIGFKLSKEPDNDCCTIHASIGRRGNRREGLEAKGPSIQPAFGEHRRSPARAPKPQSPRLNRSASEQAVRATWSLIHGLLGCSSSNRVLSRPPNLTSRVCEA